MLAAGAGGDGAGAGAGAVGGAADIGGASGVGGAASGGLGGGGPSSDAGAMDASVDASRADTGVDVGVDASDGVMGMHAGACDGNFFVNTRADVAAIAGCTSITGNLTVENSALVTLELPLLEVVLGNVIIKDNTALTSIGLAALTTVGGSTEPVQGHVAVIDNDALTTADLSKLEHALKSVDFSDNAKLVHLRLPKLTQTGALQIYGHDALVTLELPVLATVEGLLQLTANFVLPELVLPVLTSVGDYFQVVNNYELVTFAFPMLTTVGGESFDVSNNTKLTNCQAQIVLDQLEGYTGDTLIDNDRVNPDVCP